MTVRSEGVSRRTKSQTVKLSYTHIERFASSSIISRGQFSEKNSENENDRRTLLKVVFAYFTLSTTSSTVFPSIGSMTSRQFFSSLYSWCFSDLPRNCVAYSASAFVAVTLNSPSYCPGGCVLKTSTKIQMADVSLRSRFIYETGISIRTSASGTPKIGTTRRNFSFHLRLYDYGITCLLFDLLVFLTFKTDPNRLQRLFCNCLPVLMVKLLK